MKILFIRKLLVAFTVMLAFASVATAVDFIKANNTTALNLAGSWVNAATPTSSDLAIWDATVTGANTVAIGGNLSLAGIKFTNPGGNVQINGTSDLTLGSSGIDLTANSGNRSLIIFPKIVLAANQTWTGGPLTLSGGIDVAGYTFTLNSPATINTAGISGSGSIIKNVAGNLSITSNGTFNGTLTINTGQVYLGQGGATGSLGSGATITGAGTGGQLSIFRSNSFTLDNTITGLIALNKYSASTTTLTGSNTYSLATTVNAGTLQIGDGGTTGSIGGTSGVSVVAGATLAFNRTDNYGGNFTQVISGGGGVTLTTGSLTLTGTNTYTGATTINGGNLTISGQTLSSGFAVNSGGTLTLNYSGNYNGPSGSGDIVQNFAGNVSFTTNGTFSGTLTINTGQVYFGAGGTAGYLGSGATITGAGAGGQLSMFRSNNFTLDNTITGLIQLFKYSTGTTTVTGANTYTRATSIQAGALVVSSLNSVVGGTASSSLGAPTTIANGTIGLGQSGGAATGQLTYNGTGETTDRVINLQAVTGGGILDQSGTGLLKFTSNMTATGGGSKTLTLQGSTAGIGELAGNIVNPTGFTTSVTKTGTGTWTLSGANTYTGSTTVSAGTLLINGSTTATSVVTVDSSATLGGSGTVGGNTTISGTHSPGNSPGLQTFTNNLTYNASSSVLWELTANSTAGRGTTYDGIDVGGDLTFAGATAMTLSFNLASVVDWSDATWATDITGIAGWKVYDVTGAGSLTGFGNLSINLANWADAQGDLLQSVRTGSSFSLYQDGTDIYLNYAVPEPSTWALIAFSLTTVMVLRRRAS